MIPSDKKKGELSKGFKINLPLPPRSVPFIRPPLIKREEPLLKTNYQPLPPFKSQFSTQGSPLPPTSQFNVLQEQELLKSPDKGSQSSSPVSSEHSLSLGKKVLQNIESQLLRFDNYTSNHRIFCNMNVFANVFTLDRGEIVHTYNFDRFLKIVNDIIHGELSIFVLKMFLKLADDARKNQNTQHQRTQINLWERKMIPDFLVTDKRHGLGSCRVYIRVYDLTQFKVGSNYSYLCRIRQKSFSEILCLRGDLKLINFYIGRTMAKNRINHPFQNIKDVMISQADVLKVLYPVLSLRPDPKIFRIKNMIHYETNKKRFRRKRRFIVKKSTFPVMDGTFKGIGVDKLPCYSSGPAYLRKYGRTSLIYNNRHPVLEYVPKQWRSKFNHGMKMKGNKSQKMVKKKTLSDGNITYTNSNRRVPKPPPNILPENLTPRRSIRGVNPVSYYSKPTVREAKLNNNAEKYVHKVFHFQDTEPTPSKTTWVVEIRPQVKVKETDKQTFEAKVYQYAHTSNDHFMDMTPKFRKATPLGEENAAILYISRIKDLFTTHQKTTLVFTHDVKPGERPIIQPLRKEKKQDEMGYKKAGMKKKRNSRKKKSGMVSVKGNLPPLSKLPPPNTSRVSFKPPNIPHQNITIKGTVPKDILNGIVTPRIDKRLATRQNISELDGEIKSIDKNVLSGPRIPPPYIFPNDANNAGLQRPDLRRPPIPRGGANRGGVNKGGFRGGFRGAVRGNHRGGSNRGFGHNEPRVHPPGYKKKK